MLIIENVENKEVKGRQMYPHCHQAEMTRLTSYCVSLQSQECAQIFSFSGVHTITVCVPLCILSSVCILIEKTHTSPTPKGLQRDQTS